tara:strand:- start:54 stop:260 length:207 start_codon:yes stop_codon:yes gene_type:complete
MMKGVNELGIHDMLRFMMDIKKQFSGFEYLTMNVVIDGKKLNIRSDFKGFSMKIVDEKSLSKDNEQIY